MNAPSAYDDDLFKGSLEQGRRAVDEYYTGLRSHADSDLADRGLAYSRVARNGAGTGVMDELDVEQGRAFQDVLRPLMRERAQTLASERNQALSGAMGAAGLFGNLERGERDEMRGERGYVDNLRRTARSDAMEEYGLAEDSRRSSEADFQRYLAMLMGIGDPGQALGAMGGAAGQLGSSAAGYGARREGAEAQTGGFLEALMNSGLLSRRKR
jgi:hypothetical protein